MVVSTMASLEILDRQRSIFLEQLANSRPWLTSLTAQGLLTDKKLCGTEVDQERKLTPEATDMMLQCNASYNAVTGLAWKVPSA